LGKSHLYFGCRNQKEDFIYDEEQREGLTKGAITGHYVAFSRDQKEKVYVQDKILENGSEIWDMISKGGYIYVCGDAKYMAKDVDSKLEQIISKYGEKNESDTKIFVEKLLKNNRYLRDVWSP
jgi:sulfite reductase alpha subunit-like flavoprotein